ncbi:MAG: hypothetical protein ACJAUV_000330 [Flavobacteriales bacterium]|jgi:hypothetical protein
MNQLLKKVYPHVVAILVFIGLSAAYFSPVLEGYKLRQGDIKNWQGMSKEIIDFNETADTPTLWTNSMFGGMPAYQISVKYTSNLTAKIYTFFKLGLNRPIDNVFLYMAGFYLLLISFGVSPWLAIVGAIAYAFSSYYIVIIEAGHMSKAAASAYMAPVFASLVYAFKRQKRWLGAGLFALFLSLQLYCNHLQVTYYLAFMVGVYCIYELMNAIKEKQLNRFLITSSLLIVGASFALLANSGNLFGTVEYGEYTTRGKSELTINANGQSNEANKTEGLNRDYVTAWSYGQQETFTYLIPNAKGGATGRIGADAKALTKASPAFRKNIAQSNQYWGNQTFTSGPVYLGAIICLLFVLGLVLLPGKLKWYLLGVGVLATLLGWGKNLMWLTDMFLDYMPGYNKFRTVTIILILVQLIVPLIGILWLKDLIDRTAFYQVNKKKVLYTLLSFSGVLLVISLAPATFFDFLSNAELAQWDQLTASGQGAGASQFFAELAQVRVALFKSDAFRSLGFVVVSGALIWFFIGGKLKPIYLIVSLGLLVLIDMWNVDKRYLNNDKTAGKYQKWEKKIDYSLPYQPGAADQGILRNELIENPSLNTQIQERLTWKQNEAKKEGEILKQKNKANIPFEALNLNSNYRVLTLGNPFNESNTSYFHKSIGGYHGAKMKRYQELIDFHISSEMQQLVTYLQSGISVDSMQKQFVNLKVLNMLNTKYYVYNRDAAPLKNMARYGNAWFVNSVKWAANANEEILSLNQTDLKNVVVIDERFKTLVPEMIMDTTATIAMTSYKPNELIYQSSTQKEQFVVFSEIHYDKGWNAYIDNQLVPHVRVNYLLRGLTIPAGEHTILFKFEPKSFEISSNLAILGNIGVILLFGFSLFKEWKSSTTEA